MNDPKAEPVFCPACGGRVYATIGARVECPNCGQSIQVEYDSGSDAPPIIPKSVQLPKRIERQPFDVMLWLLLGFIGIGAFLLSIAEPVSGMSFAGNFAIVGGVACVYLLPALNAYSARHQSATGILVLNIALGWTAIGWIIALVWSAAGTRRST